MQIISLEIWQTIEKDIGFNPSVPEAFAAVVYKLQQVNSAAICMLVEELHFLNLINEPGQDADIFGVQVIKLCRRISGTGFGPDDLGILATN